MTKQKECTEIEYNFNLDSLYLYSGRKEDVIGSIDVYNFVFDIGSSGKVIGVEVENVSKLFNLKPEMLKNIDGAKIIVKREGNMLVLGFNIDMKQKVYNYNYLIPRGNISKLQPQPITS